MMDSHHISFDATYASDDSDEIKSRYKIICRYPLVLQINNIYSSQHGNRERYFMVDTILTKDEYMIGAVQSSQLTICTNKRFLKLMPAIDNESNIRTSYELADVRTVKMTQYMPDTADVVYIYRYNESSHSLSVCKCMNYGLRYSYPDIQCPNFDHEIPLELILFATNLYGKNYGSIKKLLKIKKDSNHTHEIKKLEYCDLKPDYKDHMIEFKDRMQAVLDNKSREIMQNKNILC